MLYAGKRALALSGHADYTRYDDIIPAFMHFPPIHMLKLIFHVPTWSVVSCLQEPYYASCELNPVTVGEAGEEME